MAAAPDPDSLAPSLAADATILVVTGAGVSAESGVPTFRGDGGLWRSHRAEDLATPAAFARDPRLVWEWYDWRRETIAGCRPNPAHVAIAELQQAFARAHLVTQNIDGLHRDAGSSRSIELHGCIWRLRCTVCGARHEDRRVPLPELPPACAACGELARPDVVWFGEALDAVDLEQAFALAASAALVLVVGTSSLVQPAASLAFQALSAGAIVIEVNPEPTPLTPHATHALALPAAQVLPTLAGLIVARAQGER